MEFNPKNMKHSKKNFFFLLSAIPTVLIFIFAFVILWNREDFLTELENTTYQDYLTNTTVSGALADKIIGTWNLSGTTITFKPHSVLEYSENKKQLATLGWQTTQKDIVVSYIPNDKSTQIIQKNYPVSSISESKFTTILNNQEVMFTRDEILSKPIVYGYAQERMENKDILSMIYENGYWYYILGAMICLYAFIAFQIFQLYIQAQSDGIRITPRQFPKAYATFIEMAKQLGFETIPELYLKNGNGIYNAYATCIPGYRSFAVVHAEIFEAYENGGDEGVFRFVVGHELGHVRMGHVSPLKAMMRILGGLPFVKYVIGLPGSRAVEYEADKVGEFLAPGQGAKSLLMLLSSKSLYNHIDIDAYCADCEQHNKIGYFLENAMVDHPIIPWRIDVLKNNKKEGGIFFHTFGKTDPNQKK